MLFGMDIQYQVVYEHLRRRIESGEWSVGHRIPSIAELQDEYRVHSLNTVRRAQQMLVEDGMLETRQGLGAFVTAVSARPRPSESQPPNLGLRFEFFVDGTIEGTLSREDLRAVGIPRRGDRLGRGALGGLVHDVVGLDLEIADVDHYPAIPGHDSGEPLAIAVVRLDRTCTDAAAHSSALRDQGWQLHDMRPRALEVSQ